MLRHGSERRELGNPRIIAGANGLQQLGRWGQLQELLEEPERVLCAATLLELHGRLLEKGRDLAPRRGRRQAWRQRGFGQTGVILREGHHKESSAHGGGKRVQSVWCGRCHHERRVLAVRLTLVQQAVDAGENG